jgi:hypothetical protein
MQYFFLLDANRFQNEVAPALGAARVAQFFAPARSLCRELNSDPNILNQQGLHTSADWLVQKLTTGSVPFRGDLWRLLVGEVFLLAAAELPEIETPLETLAALLHLQLGEDRPAFSPLQQCIRGSRDVVFGGGYYRPDHAGWNDCSDVERLAGWLSRIQPADWTAADLASADAEDELQFAQEWFPALVGMYRRAVERGYVIICEQL